MITGVLRFPGRPVNINVVSLVRHTHESMAAAPIELQTGCSFAHLDAATARELAKALLDAAAAAESAPAQAVRP